MLDALTVDQQNALIIGACIFGAIVFCFVEIFDWLKDRKEKIADAFAEGCDAFWRARMLTDNPYPEHSAAALNWARGFRQSVAIATHQTGFPVEFSDTKQ